MCGLGIDAARARRIHPARLDRLLTEAAVTTVQHIADLEPARGTAILIAQAADLETRLANAILAMFEKYIDSLFSKAQNRDERRFQATKRDVAKALLLFRRIIAALKQAQASGENGVAVVDREVGLKRLDDALPIIGSVAEVADPGILVTAAEPYSVLRRFSPRFLAAFRFVSIFREAEDEHMQGNVGALANGLSLARGAQHAARLARHLDKEPCHRQRVHRGAASPRGRGDPEARSAVMS